MPMHRAMPAIGLMALTLAWAASGAPAPTSTPAAPAAAPPLSATEQWIKEVKTPTTWLAWGADMRLRNEYFNNAISLSPDTAIGGPPAEFHEQDYFRFRGRLWATVTPVKNLDFNARITAEPRLWMKPSFSGVVRGNTSATSAPGNTGWDWTEGIIDTLNVKYKEAFGLPMTVTVGRQDILIGDYWNWWLFADGTPNHGSRTFFLDAARLTYELKDAKTTFDVIGIYQQAENDAWLPPINHLERALTDQDERGVAFYVSNKSIQNHQLDGFFVYKHDDAVITDNELEYAYRFGDDADIYTVGGKASGDLIEHLKYSVEGAYQFGSRRSPVGLTLGDRQTIDAWGLNSRVAYSFKDPLNNQLRISHEYLSGDDPNTPENENFDLLWGRWPRFSELYIYSMSREWRVAQFHNIHRVGPGWSITPVKDLVFSADYNAMFANQERVGSAFGDGDFRGHYLQAVLRYKFSQHLSGHLWSEFVWPGDFYADNEMFSFLRAEIYMTF